MAHAQKMLPELPQELFLKVLHSVNVADDATTAKALRLVNRALALRFARAVWIVGARSHYLGYLLRLTAFQRRMTIHLLCGGEIGAWNMRRTLRQAAANAAEATSAAIVHDAELFKQLSRCTKFRG